MIEFLPNVTKLKINKKINSRFTPMTINLGEIKGGDAPNIVPSYCETIVDIRYPLGIKKEEIIEKIKSSMSSFNKKNKGGKIVLKEILQDTSPHILDIDAHPFIKTFLKASEEMKEKMKLVTIGGNSVGKLLYFAGIPSFSHSPEDIPTAHQANESVSLKNLKKCAILWANFLDKISKSGGLKLNIIIGYFIKAISIAFVFGILILFP